MKEGVRSYFEADPKYSRLIDFFSDNPNWYSADYMLECLTWGGLRHTEAWNVLLSDEQEKNKYYDQFNNIISALPKDCN